MTIWEQSWVRIDHDGLDDPPDVADVPMWAVIAVLFLALPVVLVWLLAEGVAKTLEPPCR